MFLHNFTVQKCNSPNSPLTFSLFPDALIVEVESHSPKTLQPQVQKKTSVLT